MAACVEGKHGLGLIFLLFFVRVCIQLQICKIFDMRAFLSFNILIVITWNCMAVVKMFTQLSNSINGEPSSSHERFGENLLYV